jgi:uncharacterized protein DUF1214
MKDNPPAAVDAPQLAKFARIGIVPGQDFDATKLKADFVKRIPEVGFDRIMLQFKINKDVKDENGWAYTTKTGICGTDYLMRALVTAIGLGANRPQDAVYPTSLKDGEGWKYNGENRYVMHFPEGQLPPARGFWSPGRIDRSLHPEGQPRCRQGVELATSAFRRLCPNVAVIWPDESDLVAASVRAAVCSFSWDLANAARSPACAAAADPATPATPDTAGTAGTARSTATAATNPGQLHVAASVFPIEDIERGERDIGHFLVAKNEALIGRGVVRLRDTGSGHRGCGCTTRQRKTQSGGTQHLHGGRFGRAFLLRSLLDP